MKKTLSFLALFSLALLVLPAVYGNLPDPVKEFFYEKELEKQQQYLENIANKILFDEPFLVPALTALSFYPELHDTPIRFESKNIKTTMACLPKANFLFKTKEKREYLILADNKLKNNKGVLPENVPFNAQVGVFGHELAHVADYSSKTKFGIIFTGIGYIFPELRRKTEEKTDRIAIAHGLGYQVKDFSDFVINRSGASEKYLKYKLKYYFTPAQIMTIISQSSIY